MSESENPAIDSPTPKTANPRTNKDWWPNQIDLSVLHQNSAKSNPMGKDFNYAEAFKGLDVEAVKRDVVEVMTNSQEWWPADYGNYGPLFIRLTWHAAGTYRIEDGRGGGGQGAQRFAPLNSWPDNGNLDKARRLLWPVKQKYGNKISWADLLVLAGNAAMEAMGFKTFGFAFGRPDIWEPEEINWGTEDTWLGDERYSGDRELGGPFGAVQMGLIYVNPEGPNGNPDPLAAARDIRETFSRMAMNDEETVALIAGGHTFGKAHGAVDPEYVGPEPEGCPVHGAGLRLGELLRRRQGRPLDDQRSRGRLDQQPDPVGQRVLREPVQLRLRTDEEPGRGPSVDARGIPRRRTPFPDAHDPSKRHAPMMLTTDLALKLDPDLRADLPALLREPATSSPTPSPRRGTSCCTVTWARSRASWARGCRAAQLWQDPVPAVDHALLDESDVTALKAKILGSGLSISQLVSTAWASASTYRDTDKRGGANGARIRLAPQKDWEVNDPSELAKVLQTLEGVQQDFNGSLSGGKKVSLADVIVIGGAAAIEQAAKAAGHNITVPVALGRTDASQDQTDVEAFAVLEPKWDGFRNYFRPEDKMPPEQRLVEKAYMLNLTAPEMTVLVGGLRALNANYGGTAHGVFTDRPETLTNDFFVNLLDMGTVWSPSASQENVFEGSDRSTGERKRTATAADLVFGSNSVLRAIAEVYAQDDNKEKFVADFVAAWNKVMNNDRYDLHN